MARISVKTVLDAPLSEVWDRLQSPDTLRYVSAPLLRFRPITPPELPGTWSQNEYRVGLWLFGIVPLGSQMIVITIPCVDAPDRVIRDNGRGALARRWDHRISLSPDGDRTQYRDDVEIEAGLLTPVVLGFAHLFYRHRHRRWRRLLREGRSE